MVETIIDDKIIERVSDIARLKLSETEKEKFEEDLRGFLRNFPLLMRLKLAKMNCIMFRKC